MSSEIFSQSDIDALLGGDFGFGARAEARKEHNPGSDVQLYDFRRPHRVSKDKLRALEAMYERVAKALESWMIGRIRGQIEISLQSVEQISFGEFQLSLMNPCASYIFDVKDSGGQQGIIDIGLETAYYVVERLFGGTGTPAIQERGLTKIERRAVLLLAERLLELLEEVWREQLPMELGLSGFESVPEILQSANREDPMLIANLEVRAGTTVGLIGICLPFVALEKFFSHQGNGRIKNPAGSSREMEVARHLTEGLLLETQLPISSRIPAFQLTMREVAALDVGSVVMTGVPCNSEMELWVAGEPRMRALPGRSGQTLALQITQPLSSPDLRLALSTSEPEQRT
jgi:flagellar motor switch protein FliM